MPEINIYEKIKIVETELEDIIKFDDFRAAKNAFDSLEDSFDNKKRQLDPKVSKQLKLLINTLKWISLPLLDQKEILNLFSKHFPLSFEIPEYDHEHKMKHFLLGIFPEEDRDVFKEKIKATLNKNKDLLTKALDGYLSGSFENWVKYYSSKLGLGKIEQFKQQEFFVTDPQIGNLNEEEKDRVLNFFKFYELLKLSSVSAEGYEGIIPVNEDHFQGYIHDGKLLKTSRLDPKLERIMKAVRGEYVSGKNSKSLGPPKTESEKNIEKLRAEEAALPEDSLERMALDEEVDKQKHLEDLQYQATQFADGSLERMALEEEISRLKK